MGWGGGGGRGGGGEKNSFTSAVLGTLSQNTSILMSPRVVCNVTDMVSLATYLPVHRFVNNSMYRSWL